MTRYAKVPIIGEFKDVCAIAIGGIMGSGKTTTACFFAAQVVLKRGKLAVVDPHGNAHITIRKETLSYNLEPLVGSYLCDVAVDEDDIVNTVELVNDVLRERKRGSSIDYPVFLFVDEFSSLMRSSAVSGAIVPLLENIATEGRKFLVGAVLLGQQWNVDRAGGSPLRDVVTSAYVHRMRKRTARMLIDGVDEDTSSLKDGEALLYQARRGTIKVQIPLTTYEDLVRVGQMMTTPAETTNKQQINNNAGVVYRRPDEENGHSAGDQVKRRVIALFLNGNNITFIAREVYKTTSGPPYIRALDEVNEIIREYILGAGGNNA